MLVDSHVHISMKDYDTDREEVIRRARAAGVRLMVEVGYDLESSERAVGLARTNEGIVAAVGVHPHDAKTWNREASDRIEELAKEDSVVAIGEIGLDYYRNLSSPQEQAAAFRAQIDLAARLNLPVIIHERDAFEDVLSILVDAGAERLPGVVMHCFSGDWRAARRCLDRGFYISIAGPVTYKNSKFQEQVARLCPLDRLLTETDSPYLTPSPFRGKRNEPSYVKDVTEHIARIRSMPVEILGKTVLENAYKAFGLDEVKDQVR
ncbi:MAG TPA: TatD family hydrolase [Clostridia bacterium]|nr:TatD family hydrolase [Clostridia bacterium]